MDLASSSHKVKCYCFQACACHYTGASGMPAQLSVNKELKWKRN